MGFENQEGLGSTPGLTTQYLGQVASPAQPLVSSSVKWDC